jgi:hypothetical protein
METICLGRCHTDPSMSSFLSGPTDHCHAPNLEKSHIVQLKTKIKSQAAHSEEPTSTVLYSAMRCFPLDAANQLPKTDSLMRTIRRQRQAVATDVPSTIPEHLKQTDRGENFVLHESKNLIIYTTVSNISVLKTCKHWFADGTFKVRLV